MKTLKNVSTMYRDFEEGSTIILGDRVSVDALKSLISDLVEDVFVTLKSKGYVADIHNKDFGNKISDKQWDATTEAEDNPGGPHSDVPIKKKDGTVTEAKTRVPNDDGSEKVMKPKDFKKSVTPGSTSKLVSNSEKYGHGVAEESKDGFSRQMIEPKYQGTDADPNTKVAKESPWDMQRQNLKEREERGETPEKGWKKASVSSEAAAGIIETVLAIKSRLRPVKRYAAQPYKKDFGSGIKDEKTNREYTAQEDAAVGPRSDVTRVYSKADGARETKVYPRQTRVPNKDAAGADNTIKPKDFDPKKHGSPSTHISEPTSSGVDDKIKENIRSTGQKDPTDSKNEPKAIKSTGKDVEVDADRDAELKKLQAEENKKNPPKGGTKPVKDAPL